MHAAEDDPSFAGHSFDDGGSPIGIPAHHRAPAGKLRAILPVMLEQWCASAGNGHGSLVDTSIHDRVKAEPNARQI